MQWFSKWDNEVLQRVLESFADSWDPYWSLTETVDQWTLTGPFSSICTWTLRPLFPLGLNQFYFFPSPNIEPVQNVSTVNELVQAPKSCFRTGTKQNVTGYVKVSKNLGWNKPVLEPKLFGCKRDLRVMRALMNTIKLLLKLKLKFENHCPTNVSNALISKSLKILAVAGLETDKLYVWL